MSGHDNHNYNRTYDGREISVGLSGITQYAVGVTDEKAPKNEILTPQALAESLALFNTILNSTALKEAVALLKDHIANKDNPHGVDLDQFILDIGDAIYGEFVNNGGKCSKERYLNSLFNTLYVASVDEMKEPIDRHAIVSVAGATRFMREHELDPDAHAKLIDDLLPGEPLRDDPMSALYAFTGIPPSMIFKDEYVYPVHLYPDEYNVVPYSYVGHDGNVHYCNSVDTLPIDYINGEPYIPLFGERINYILNSATLLTHSFHNVNVVHNDGRAPDGTITANSVRTSNDVDDAVHMVSLQTVPIKKDQHISFSVYAKPSDCDKLAISYRTNDNTNIVVTGVYHLIEGYSMLANPMEEHSASIQVLNDGWCRCKITIYNTLGDVGDFSLIFFKGDGTSLGYKADTSTCGYLWGLQLEEGPSISPYMPTTDVPSVRKSLMIRMPMTEGDETGRPKYSVAVATRGIGNNKSWREDRVIFSIMDSDMFPTAIARYKSFESVLISRRAKTYTEEVGVFIGTDITSSSYEVTSGALMQVIHGTDQARIINAVNDSVVESVHAHDQWDKDSYLLIGSDNNGHYLDGYLRHALIYTFVIATDEAKFINGDQINE